uniref:Transport and Golgi organization protein 1 homolog n=1 Tax=Phasianus colchicus TaxID=9054 RepID=A0A669P460_PHACC
MAAAAPPDPRLLLAVLLLLPPPGPLCAAGPELSRRFTERKRCADPECSKLMCRGKAMKDFQGPDCRFVNFKKGETIYVYYKLIGMSTELWAGSIGSDFGYFPKDLLEINHNYTNEELELPTEETDFVCFQDGRDDFDNYNVDELLKSSEETIANERDIESSDPGTNPAERTERDEEEGKVDTVVFHDALETDSLELTRLEDKEALAMTEEVDSSFKEGTENAGINPTVNSHEEISQGEQIAHEHLQGMLSENLKGLESENTKNSSIPQGETSQLDKESEEINAYTLLNRELSVNLKTKFGSTADAVVSDDEVTRLVTSMENDFNEDLSINAYDAEEESDFVDQFEEIPLLSFTTEEKSISLVDSEADESNGFESKHHKLDEYANGATELNSQRDNEEERDSDALITKDAFSENKKSGDSVNMDMFESEQTKEKQDEAMPVSKREAPTATQLDDLSKERIRREPVGASDADSKEKTNKTEQFEEQLMTDETVLHSEELKSTAVPDPRVLPSPRDGLKFKSFVESKQDALSPPAGDVNQTPEGVPLAEIEKEEEKFEGDTLKESSESNFKHRKLWEKMKEKEKAKYEPSGDVSASVEDIQNASRSDAGDTDLLKDKLEQGMPAVEKEILRQEDLKQTEQADPENQKPISVKKEPEIERGNMKETSANEGDPSHRGAAEQPRPWENETDSAREKTLRLELQSEEPDAEEDPDLKQEEELLEDENAASAKLLQARLANVQGNTQTIRNTNPDLGVLNEAVSATANPTYETGEETDSFSEETKKISRLQDVLEAGNKEVDKPVTEDTKLDEIERAVEEDKESPEAEDPSAVEEHIFKSPDRKDSNDFNQRKNHLPEGISLGDSKEIQNSEDTRNTHQHSAHFPSPVDIAATNDTVTDYSESVKRLTITRDFLDEKRVIRLQKYLGLQNVIRIEAMFQDMKIEMELARKASQNNEEIEKALDQILKSSDSSIMDVVGKVLDSRVAENQEEVVKEMDLYDEESALMDDIQELIYSLRSKYSSASESVPLASFLEQEEDELHAQGRISECTYMENLRELSVLHKKTNKKNKSLLTAPIRNLHGIDESNQKFQQLEDKRPFLPMEEEEEEEEEKEEEETAVNIPPEDEEATFSDNREAADGYNSERGLLLLAATLPEDIRPGPDFHGLPWEPVVVTALVGMATLAIIFWRTCLSVSVPRAREPADTSGTVCAVNSLCTETKNDTVKGLEETNHQLDDKIKSLCTMLDTERKQNAKKQKKVRAVTPVSCIVQIALNESKLSEEKVKAELQHVQEENARLKKSKEQLLKEAEGWSERHTELTEQIKLYRKSQKDIEEALAYKENEIEVELLSCITAPVANSSLTFASPTEQIKKLEHDSSSLQSAKARLENECKTLQQKVEILGELYQQKEMALQKKLTQEEYERQEKEQKLSAADEKAVLAIEEVKVYKQRIQDMEEELQKTERSYKNQIAAHEKKAHDNWLIARSAERALAEEKREAANLRQKLMEVNQKTIMLQRPLIVKPTPGRPDRQVPPRRVPLSRDGSFGPSPVSGGNPSPTQMMEVPSRPLSAPQREGSRAEFGTVVDGPPAPRRPPELPGRMSVPGKLCGPQCTQSFSSEMDPEEPEPHSFSKSMTKTCLCGSLCRSWACCSIPDQQWAENFLSCHSKG